MTIDTPSQGIRTDDLSFAECYGYDPHPHGVGGYLRFRCPRHGGDHQKSLSINEATKQFRCFACGIWGTLTEHQQARCFPASARSNSWGNPRGGQRSQTPLSQVGASHSQMAKLPVSLNAQAPPQEPMSPVPAAVTRAVQSWKAFEKSPAQVYAKNRGVPAALARQLHLGCWQGNWGGEKSEWLTFPLRCPVNGQPVGVYGRNLHSNEQSKKGRVFGNKGMFGGSKPGLMPSDVILVEGPFEAIAVLNSPGLPAVRALCGTSTRPEWFDECERIVLLLDDDTPGHAAMEAQVKALADRRHQRSTGPQVLRLHSGSLREKHGVKDLGEMLSQGKPITLNLPAVPPPKQPSACPQDASTNNQAEAAMSDRLPGNQTILESVYELFEGASELFEDLTLDI